MRNGCAADVWGLRGLAPVVALHTPHRADARFSLATSRPRGICRNAPTEQPHCAVKSLPCAWKFRSRISTHTTAPFSFAGEPFKPLNGGGQPSRCERAERSGDHVRPQGHNGIAHGGSRDFGLPLSQGNRSSLWTGAVSPPDVNERSDSGDHVRLRATSGLLRGEPTCRGACPCRSRRAQRCLLHRSDFGIRALQTPSPSRGAKRCLPLWGGD